MPSEITAKPLTPFIEANVESLTKELDDKLDKIEI